MNKKQKILFIINYVIIFCLLMSNNIILIIYLYNTNTHNIFEDNILKTVEIKSSDDEESWSFATGCFIDKNGLILTNRHVVYNSTKESNYKIIKVRQANMNNWITAEIINISEDNDLATIKINQKNSCFFELQENISNGETIYTIGNPNGFGLSFSSGVISSNNKNVIYQNKTIYAFQTSLVINEGNSGGPVFNKRGKLLGIISFRLKDKNNDVIQGVSFAIPSTTISEFI